MHQESTAQPSFVPSTTTAVPLLFAALFLSGLAAIVNETVWQRALKIYLAGCESTSAMIVVLVFMLGLGAGSLCMGLMAHRIKHPLRTLALIELLLCCVNLAIAGALAVDISETIYSFQRLAVSLGIPLRLIYGLTAVVVLLVPCFLMGITMPLVSEVAQRQLKCETPRFITILFVLNTLGAVLGGVAAGFVLLPHFGQRVSLVVGSSCNLAAAAILLGICIHHRIRAAPVHNLGLKFRSGRLLPEEVLGFWFGFLSLAYEMYLFRVAALAHQPLPYNFSLVLCCYLLFWSFGVFLAKKVRESIPGLMVLSALLVVVMPLFHWLDRHFIHYGLQAVMGERGLPLALSAAGYCLPCIPFGMLFGQVIARSATNWGNDVGRYYGLNTLGSCLGILAMTLAGFEFNHAFSALAIAAGYLALLLYASRRMKFPSPLGLPGRAGVAALAACLLFTPALYIAYDRRSDLFVPVLISQARTTYYGRGGVIEVMANNEVYWDGLRHATLSTNGSHKGSNDWLLAAVPFTCHAGDNLESLVIGLGTGVTASTLTRSDRVQSVDVYEIDHTLESVYRDFPDGTLHLTENPKLHIIWQDGRAGLALNPKQYDIISQQPMYLKQAGSSILLSREYVQLVKKRLKPNGVYCMYSNSMGNQKQALLVRKTVASVFAHCESFGGGYMIIASDQPIAYHPGRFQNSSGSDRLIEEIREMGLPWMRGYQDSPRLDWECPYLITDDHPLVEYPGVVARLLGK